jgi:methionyl-tRNA formyltransferase
MRIVFFGTPQFAVPTLEKLLNEPNLEVVGIVTQPDKKRGRGNDLIPSPIKKVAQKHHLPVWQPTKIKKDRETLDQLATARADFFVVVAYGQILSQPILAMPKLGCINVHGSILPQYRGAAPIQWSIANGDRQTGITTMLMDRGMDTGAMLLKAFTSIELLDNSQTIAVKLAELGGDLLIETLLKLADRAITPIPQNNDEATYARLITKEDFTLDWNCSNLAIHNRVRAFYPDCFTTFRNTPLKILATIPLGENYFAQIPPNYAGLIEKAKNIDPKKGKIGEIVGIIKNFGALIQTGDGILLLDQVQLAGKKAQSGSDFVNGMRVNTGEFLDRL